MKSFLTLILMEKNYHKYNTIANWKRRGIVLRENETYDMLYEKWHTTTNCEKCKVELCFGTGSKGRCLDHCHDTGYFRNILCHSCNIQRQVIPKNNISGIPNIRKRILGNYIDYQYEKTINRERHLKYFKTLEEAKEYKKNYELKYIS